MDKETDMKKRCMTKLEGKERMSALCRGASQEHITYSIDSGPKYTNVLIGLHNYNSPVHQSTQSAL